MNTLGGIHLALGITALAVGTLVVLMRKGTRLHRSIGHLYFSSMLGVNLTALLLYNLTGKFNMFHVFALLSLVTLLLGLAPVILRRPKAIWYEMHIGFMSGSYVGLVAATAAEITTRLPGMDFGTGVGVATFGVFALGALIIQRRMRRNEIQSARAGRKGT